MATHQSRPTGPSSRNSRRPRKPKDPAIGCVDCDLLAQWVEPPISGYDLKGSAGARSRSSKLTIKGLLATFEGTLGDCQPAV